MPKPTQAEVAARVAGESMKLDELPLPEPCTVRGDDGLLRYGFTTKQMRAAMRTGALAALDALLDVTGPDAAHRPEDIRRLRDTIVEGK